MKKSITTAVALAAGSLLLAACSSGAGTDVVEVTPEPTTTTAPATPEPTQGPPSGQEQSPEMDTPPPAETPSSEDGTRIVAIDEVVEGDIVTFPNPEALISIDEVSAGNRNDGTIEASGGDRVVIPLQIDVPPPMEAQFNIVYDKNFITRDNSLASETGQILSLSPEDGQGFVVVVDPSAPQGQTTITYTYLNDGIPMGGEILLKVS